jgi:hypothetical protein
MYVVDGRHILQDIAEENDRTKRKTETLFIDEKKEVGVAAAILHVHSVVHAHVLHAVQQSVLVRHVI